MTLILAQIKFETIPYKNVGGAAFQAEADPLHQILGFCRNSFSLIAPMALILKFFRLPVKRPFQKCILLPPLVYGFQVWAKCMKMCCDTQILTDSPLMEYKMNNKSPILKVLIVFDPHAIS